MNRYTITKAITTYETYSVDSDSQDNAQLLLESDPNTYFVDSETIEPGCTIVNIEKLSVAKTNCKLCNI